MYESVLEEDREDGEIVFGGRKGNGAQAGSRGILEDCAEVCVKRHGGCSGRRSVSPLKNLMLLFWCWNVQSKVLVGRLG